MGCECRFPDLPGNGARNELDVYYATLFLWTRVGPPSAEFCRTLAIFPQVDDLSFINPWEAQDEDGLSQTTLHPNSKESLMSPTHPIQWQILQVQQFGEEMVIKVQYGQQI